MKKGAHIPNGGERLVVGWKPVVIIGLMLALTATCAAEQRQSTALENDIILQVLHAQKNTCFIVSPFTQYDGRIDKRHIAALAYKYFGLMDLLKTYKDAEAKPAKTLMQQIDGLVDSFFHQNAQKTVLTLASQRDAGYIIGQECIVTANPSLPAYDPLTGNVILYLNTALPNGINDKRLVFGRYINKVFQELGHLPEGFDNRVDPEPIRLE